MLLTTAGLRHQKLREMSQTFSNLCTEIINTFIMQVILVPRVFDLPLQPPSYSQREKEREANKDAIIIYIIVRVCLLIIIIEHNIFSLPSFEVE